MRLRKFTLWKKLSIAVLNEELDGLNLNGIPKETTHKSSRVLYTC